MRPVILLVLTFAAGCKAEEKSAATPPTPGAAPTQAGAPAPANAATEAPPAPVTLTPELAIEAARTWLAALQNGDATGLAASSATPFKLEHTGIEDHFACGATEVQKDAAALQKTTACLAGLAGLRAALAGATVSPNIARPPPGAVQTPKFVADWQADHLFVFFQLQKDGAPDPDEVTHALDGLLAVRLAGGKAVVDGASLSYAAITEEID